MDDIYLLEKFLMWLRFRKIVPYMKEGSVLDFGSGKKQSLRKYLTKNYEYCGVERDYDPIKGKYDTVVMAAVLEHLDNEIEILEMLKSHMNKGSLLIITTPTSKSKKVLDILALLRLVDPENIKEHNYYWNEDELRGIAHKLGLKIDRYKKFEFGFNQIVIMQKD